MEMTMKKTTPKLEVLPLEPPFFPDDLESFSQCSRERVHLAPFFSACTTSEESARPNRREYHCLWRYLQKGQIRRPEPPR